jgi:cytochrome P450
MSTMHRDVADLVERDQVALGCPYPIFDELRAAPEGLVFSEPLGAWVATGYDDIVQILRDTSTWSSKSPICPAGRRPRLVEAIAELAAEPSLAGDLAAVISTQRQATVLLFADPPDHVRQRRAVNGAFRPSRIRNLEPMIQSISDRLLASFAGRGHAELVGEYAALLPMEVIARTLGVDDDDLLMFKRWSDDMAVPIGNASPTPDQARAYVLSSREFADHFALLLRRRHECRMDDLVSDVAHAEVDGHRLSEPEQLEVLAQLLVAGNETTTKLIANIAWHLATDPELRLRVAGDRSLVANLVEEVLRLEAPANGLFRVATTDTRVGGVDVAAGQSVWLVYAAANRDPAVFDAPSRLDETRHNASDHLAFGHGEHFCLGARLARLEANVATNAILDHLPRLAIAPQHESVWEDSFILRGLRHLHVTFDPRAR